MPRLRLASALVLSAAVFGVPALAGERIVFKNGHVLDVQSSRTEGDTVYLKLPQGGEIGVPKALIENVQVGQDVSARRAGASNLAAGPNVARGPAESELRGVKTAIAQTRRSGAMNQVRGGTVSQQAGVVLGGVPAQLGDLYNLPKEPPRQIHMRDAMHMRDEDGPLPQATPRAPGETPPAPDVGEQIRHVTIPHPKKNRAPR